MDWPNLEGPNRDRKQLLEDLAQFNPFAQSPSAWQPLPSRRRVTVIYPHNGCISSGVLSLAPGDVLEVEQAGGVWRTGSIVMSGNKTQSPPLQTGLVYSKFTVPVEPNKPNAVPQPCLDAEDDYDIEFGHPAAGQSVTYEETDYISQSSPRDEMSCVICHSLASRPHQSTCCGQTVCLACAKMWKKTNNSCPQCRQAPLNLSIDVRVERNIANLNVHCRNDTKGCDWTGRLGDVASHLNSSCQYVMRKCEHRGCSMEFLRSDLQKHMSSECQQRAVQCPCCKATRMLTNPMQFNGFTYHILITEHYKECPDWPMRCPNKCPLDNLTRASLQAHLDEDCPELIISCQFSEAGCGVRVKRREMEEHVQKAIGQHMAGMMRDYLKLKKEHAVLMKEHAACCLREEKNCTEPVLQFDSNDSCPLR